MSDLNGLENELMSWSGAPLCFAAPGRKSWQVFVLNIPAPDRHLTLSKYAIFQHHGGHNFGPPWNPPFMTAI